MSVELTCTGGSTATIRVAASRARADSANAPGAGVFLAALAVADDGRAEAADFSGPAEAADAPAGYLPGEADSAMSIHSCAIAPTLAVSVDCSMFLAQSRLSTNAAVASVSVAADSGTAFKSMPGAPAVTGVASGRATSAGSAPGTIGPNEVASSARAPMSVHDVVSAGADSGGEAVLPDACPGKPGSPHIPAQADASGVAAKPTVRLPMIQPITEAVGFKLTSEVGNPDRIGERKAGRVVGPPAPGADPASGVAPAAAPFFASVDAGSALASGTHAGLTERLAEQMSWWLSQRTHGADFKVDMPGGQAVSVSVQVRGNEAHVVFRSDQAEIRQLLGEAMPQLKQSFVSEGLLLTGVSVGAHGAGAWDQRGGGDAVPHSRKPTSREPQTVEEPASTGRVRNLSSAVSGRALDLYV